jgi:hypothetical protein
MSHGMSSSLTKARGWWWKKLIIALLLADFFFMSNNNLALHQRIKWGLQIAIDDRSFE